MTMAFPTTATPAAGFAELHRALLNGQALLSLRARWPPTSAPSQATKRTSSRCCGSCRCTATRSKRSTLPAPIFARRSLQRLDRLRGFGEEARLSQRPGDGVRRHRHDRLHDGLRDRHRASISRWSSTSNWPAAMMKIVNCTSRVAQDAGLQPLRSMRLSTSSISMTRSRGWPSKQSTCRFDSAPSAQNGKRTIAWKGTWDDGGGPALSVGSHFQDGQHARRFDRRRYRERVCRRLEAGFEGSRDLSRRLQEQPALDHDQNRIARKGEEPASNLLPRLLSSAFSSGCRHRSAGTSPPRAIR